MNNTDEHMIERESTGNCSATLLISLYLAVLAFFILLNSISEQDIKKSEKAMESLSNVFSSEGGMSDLHMKTPAIFDFNYIITDYFDRIEGSIKSVFQIDSFNIQRSGNRMMVTIPINVFYEIGSSRLKRKQTKLLNQVSKILKTEDKGARVYFDFTIDSFSYLGATKDIGREIDLARTSLVVDHLLSKNVPRELISGGIRFNNKHNITIEFIVLEAGNVTGTKDVN